MSERPPSDAVFSVSVAAPAPQPRVRVWHICPPVSPEAVDDPVIVSTADGDRWTCTEIHSGAPVL